MYVYNVIFGYKNEVKLQESFYMNILKYLHKKGVIQATT